MVYTFQLLHAADQEGGIPALDDAPRFSAVLNALANQDADADGVADFANTLKLSSGDAFIPGVFFSASEEAFGGAGRGDILIQNQLGFQAIAFGNHEFDQGTALLLDLIGGAEDDPATPEDESFVGTAFPYLSSNLDFTTDENLAGLVVPDDQAPAGNSVAATTVIDVNGELIGVVGATTPTLPVIASPGGVTVSPQPFDGTPTPEQLDALAAEIQADVDDLLAANPAVNKVVLLSHMQQLNIERALATRLSNVDIIVGGGSNTRLVDETDRLRDGDTAQGDYPEFFTGADGNPVALVNTDGNYKYVGRLVIDFDDSGVIIPESYNPEVSGAYATDQQGVATLGAENLVDPEIQAIINALEEVVIATESNVFGISEVYLDGRRGSVRIEETNLGNLTADANLAIAKATDPETVIALKNGGGIRDDIGRVIVPPGGTGEPEFLPNEGIPGIKPEGGISETDIANSLSFNNGLTLLTVTAAELLALMEHAVAASSLDDSNTQGRFPQIAGFSFSFDLTQPEGERVVSLAIEDEAGNDTDVVVQDGEIVGDPSRTFRMVTLNFLANGGDGYPFPMGESTNRVDLVSESSDAPAPESRTGDATFAPDGSEQDALAEYLEDGFGEASPFLMEETPRALDTRIQNLAFREDSVIDEPAGGQEPVELIGDEGDNELTGGNNNDLIAGELGSDLIEGGAGDDVLRGDRNARSAQVGEAGGDDLIFGGDGNDRIGGKSGNDILYGEDGDDQIWGDDSDDILYGGFGNDLLTGDNFSGGSGSDIFVLAAGEGTDTIVDFEVGVDFIGLMSGVSFGSLTREGSELRFGDEVLAIVNGVNTANLTVDSFIPSFP